MKLPWFKFYWQDFAVGVKEFSNQQIGGYMKLLLHQWDKGFLINDEKILKRLSNLSSHNLLTVKEKFKLCQDGFLRNERLDNERKEAILFHELQKTKGVKGAEKRWKNDSRGHSRGYSTGIAISEEEEESESERRKKKEERNSSAASEKFFEMFCRILKGKFVDAEIQTEVAKFMNKYPDVKPNRAASLINTWCSNLLSDLRAGQEKSWWHAI